ncbi:MAG: GumC family protein [Verrucomicrobiales bacterium]
MQDETPYASSSGSHPEASRMDIGPWIQIVLERIWLVLAVAILIGVGGAFYAFKQQDIFRATAVLNVATEEQNFVSMQEVAREELRTADALNTIAQRLKHSSTLIRVVRTNALTNHPAFKGQGNPPVSEDQAVKTLQFMVQTKVRPSTRLIDINVEHSDRRLVDLIANSVATQFIRENLDQKLNVNTDANLWLVQEAERLQAKVEKSERALQEYKEKNKASSLADQQNLVLENLKKINESYTAAQAERLQIETDLKQMELVGTNVEAIMALPSVVRDPTIQSMRARVIDQQTLVASMTNKYKPKYPKMAQALRQLEDMTRSLDQLVLNSPTLVNSAFQAAQAKERSLKAALEKAERDTLELDKLSIDYNVLSRQMTSDQTMYESVLKRLKETDLAKGLEKNAISIAEPAVPPNGPYKPDRKKIMIMAWALGLAGGIGLAFFLNYIDNSVKTVDHAESLFGLPVIGAVPMSKEAIKEHHNRVVLEEPHSSCAEAYRSLVAAVDMTGRIEEQNVILFTSAIPSEGKTFSSVNYSITHAQKGRKTLLIDFDLRRPSVAERFNVDKQTPGVTDYLLGKATLDQLVYTMPDVEHLDVLFAGPLVPNPAEQIAKPWLAQLLKEATAKYDRVVLDTPPLNAVADTTYLLPFAKVVCLVIRTGKTPVKAVRRTLQTMERAGKRPSGLVLNYLPERSGYGYYYYYHYYSSDGYNSKGVYGAGEAKKSGKGSGGSKRKSSTKNEREAEVASSR